MYNELIRTDRCLIKYMDMVKLYDEDFRILDRYRGYLEIINSRKMKYLEAHFILKTLFKESELEIFKDVDDYIVNILRRQVMNFYLKEKPDLQNGIELLNSYK